MAFGNKKKEAQANGPKKKYIYLAIKESTMKPAFSAKGDVIFSNTTEEGAQIQWNIQAKDNIPKHVEADLIALKQYREEVVKRDGDDDKQLAKDRAKDALREKHKALIEEAKELMKGQKNKKGDKVNKNEEGAGVNKAENPEKQAETITNNADTPVVIETTSEKTENGDSEATKVSDTEKQEPSVEVVPASDDAEKKNEANDNNDESVKTEKPKAKKAEKKEEKKNETKDVSPSATQDDIDSIIDAIDTTDKRTQKKLDIIGQHVVNTTEVVASIAKGFESPIRYHGERLAEGQKNIEKMTRANAKMIQEVSEQTETFQGQLKKLEQLDRITEILEDKGLEIRKTADPASRQEEDIVNMSRYAVAIIDQLTVASCELIKRQAAFDQKASAQGNVEAEVKAQLETERKNGAVDGKLEMVRAILGKFTDGVDVLRTSDDPAQKAIWTALCEQGLEVIFTKDDEVEISADEAEKNAAKYKGIDGAGKYVVVKSGLSFAGKVVFAAEFEKKAE